jgi:hypothetical protein
MPEGVARTDALLQSPKPNEPRRRRTYTSLPHGFPVAAARLSFRRSCCSVGRSDILLFRPINHGPTPSMHYHGSDGARTEHAGGTMLDRNDVWAPSEA